MAVLIVPLLRSCEGDENDDMASDAAAAVQKGKHAQRERESEQMEQWSAPMHASTI